MPKSKTRSQTKVSARTAQNVGNEHIEEQSEQPLKLLILPKDASPDARICTLPHPRTSQQCRYYVCPTRGFYEFTRIAAPKAACRSWLIGREQQARGNAVGTVKADPETTAKGQVTGEDATTTESPMRGGDRPVGDGYVIKSPELLVATPMDPVFLILPSLLASSGIASSSAAGFFLSSEDILDKICDAAAHFNQIATMNNVSQLIEARMRVVCDIVDAGGEEMFRLNIEKLSSELMVKAKKMVASGLPPSMEEKFVRKTLEKPVVAIRREETGESDNTGSTSNDTLELDPTSTESLESQGSVSAHESMASKASLTTDVTIPDAQALRVDPRAIEDLLRLRVAISYIFSSYIPQALVTTLNTKLASEVSPVNFKPLEEELALIDNMRREALASRSISDFSRKRGTEDDGAIESRAEKKAKKEEEEKKRKASETRGVRDLKKVDTSGMKKMSDFFGKKVATTKKT